VVVDEVAHHFVVVELKETQHFLVFQSLVAFGLEQSDFA
jgi:hypothetical protein